MSRMFVMSFLLHRHGMRNPFIDFEGIGDRLQPDEVGQLTEKGRQQMLALGQYLANKYRLCLTNHHNEDDSAGTLERHITAKSISSSVPRCIESSDLVLSSLLNKSPNVTLLKTDFGELYHEMIKKNIELMISSELNTDQGTRVGDYINFLNVQAKSDKKLPKEKYQIVEALLNAKKNGQTIPSFADEETLKKCLNIMNRKLISGFEDRLTSELVNDISQRLSEFPNVQANFVEYSLSDIHLVSLLERIGLPISHWPDYGSAFEIQIFTDGSITVQELYNSPEAQITEAASIRKSSVSELLSNVQNFQQRDLLQISN